MNAAVVRACVKDLIDEAKTQSVLDLRAGR